MKRWFISRLGDYEGDGTLVPKAYLYSKNIRLWSKPGFGWCFGQIGIADLTAINQDTDVHIFPDATLDLQVSGIPTGVRTTLRDKLTAAGFDFTAVKNTWTVRELLVYLLRQLQPALGTVEQGDVKDAF